MRLFLSAIENVGYCEETLAEMKRRQVKMLWNLVSYFYVRKKPDGFVESIRDMSELLMVDSGAHSFQKGVHVDWENYTREYARWIRTFDRPNVVGYFEMDVDNIIGYEEVKRLREILREESGVSEKIIPVWHKNRGIDEYKSMCREMSGHVAAVTGFRNEDIRDEQYAMFLKYARQQGTKIHCLGMARTKVLEKVPFDFADASSWVHCVNFGRKANGEKYPKPQCKQDYIDQFIDSYQRYTELQKRLYVKWRSLDKGFETVPLKN